MIKGLVMVGTTTFDTLIASLDKSSDRISLTFQIANGNYIPTCHKYERFIPNIKTIYSDFDFIITHAGAGSVYNLLEQRYKFAVVPNLERSDKHQLELANYVEINNYASTFMVDEFNDVELFDLYIAILEKTHNIYKKEPFFKGKEIIEFILGND